MSHENLMRRHPTIFAYAHNGTRRSCMGFGCECGPGWGALLSRLCRRLDAFRKLLRVDVRATQVKEKYGTLRFYYVEILPCWLREWRAVNRLVWRLVDACVRRAECESARTCEECGAPARTMAHHGWWSTICRACRGVD